MSASRLVRVLPAVALMVALAGCGTTDGEPPSRITNQTQTTWPTQSNGPESPSVPPPTVE